LNRGGHDNLWWAGNYGTAFDSASVTLADVANPVVSTLSPTDAATGVAIDSDLVITFDEAVDVESGNVTIKKGDDDSTVEAIDVTSNQVTGTGTTEITIDPTDDLEEQTDYYVQIDATAFDDASGNSYAGINDTTTWNFTTADETDPAVSTLSPADNATTVAVDTSLIMTFSEAADVESGNITIYKTDGSLIETIDVTGSLVTGTGTRQISVNPTSNLNNDTNYYVLIDATAFDDEAGNSYAGIGDATTWNFKTVGGGGGEPAPVQSDPEPMPDPVTNTDSEGAEIPEGTVQEEQEIETEPAEVYGLRVKAPDYDQVKSVTIKINGQVHTLQLDKSDEGNPSFTKELAILKPGRYPYLITIDYGSTNRHIRGVYAVKAPEVEEVEVPMPVAATTGGRGTRQYMMPVQERAEQVKLREEPEREIEKPSPKITPVPEQELEEGVEVTFFKIVTGSVGSFGRGVAGKMSSGTKRLAEMTRGMGDFLTARISSFKIAMPSNQKHIYDKVTIKLASAEGTALSGAKVTLHSEPKVAVTDEEGKAEFFGVEAGKHKLVINYEDYTSKQSVVLDQEIEEVTIHITAEFKKDRGWW